MNKSIISLFIICCFALPGAAQKWKVLPSTIQAIRGGKAAVEVLPVTHITIPASQAIMANSSARFLSQYTHHLSRIEQLKPLARPVELTPSTVKTPDISSLTKGAEGFSSGEHSALQAQVELKMQNFQKTSILYSWGRFLVQNGAVSAVTPSKITEELGVVMLKANNQLFWIEPPLSIDTKNLSPLEIFTYTSSLQKVLSILPVETLEIFWAQTPEKLAIFTYLRENFEAAFSELEAANDAFLSIKPTRNWLFQESKQTRLVRQNYQISAANAALTAGQLLQFMASEENAVFSRTFAAYRQLSAAKTHNMTLSGKFNQIWRKGPKGPLEI